MRWTEPANDLNIIRNNLKWVSNNSATNLGGGGSQNRSSLTLTIMGILQW